jgi:hypothetical protein
MWPSLNKRKNHTFLIRDDMATRLCGQPGCTSKATLVWEIDDGYGQSCCPVLRCDTCRPPDTTWYEKKHKYAPKYDDFHLRLTSKLPPDWCWTSDGVGNPPPLCWDCQQRITTAKRGHGNAIDADGRHIGIYFCKPCYKARDCQPPIIPHM